MSDQEKDEKTEDATPKKRDEARQKGQVAMSTELIASVALVAGLASMIYSGGSMMNRIGTNTVDAISILGLLGTSELSVGMAAALLSESLTSVLGNLALVTLPAIALSLLVGYLQVGFKITPEALELKWDKVNPITGWGRFFSMRSVVRTVMSGVKISMITTVVVLIAWNHVEDLARVGVNEIGPLLRAIGKIVLHCVVGALTVVLLLSVIDFAFQRMQHSKDIRMTKKEVKEEAKMADGDPHVRARIRRMQLELANNRMMADVPDATVIITNPTHYAVALLYEQGELGGKAQTAPVVVAKGVDSMAQRIKALGRDHGVVCYEDVPLARSLHAQCDVGQEIPEDLYQAVAAVLGYVYRLRGMSSRTPQMAGV